MPRHQHLPLLPICCCWILMVLGFNSLAFSQGPLFPIHKEGQGYLIDTNGRAVVGPLPYRILEAKNGAAVVKRPKPDWPQPLTPPQVSFIWDTLEKVGLIDYQGKILVPLQYPNWMEIGHGIYRCYDEEKQQHAADATIHVPDDWVLANNKGLLLKGRMLDDINYTFYHGLLPVLDSNRIALIDSTGDIGAGFVYDEAIICPRRPDALYLHREGVWYALHSGGRVKAMDWPGDLRVMIGGRSWAGGESYYPSVGSAEGCWLQRTEAIDGGEALITDSWGVHRWFIGADDRLYTEQQWHAARLAKLGLEVVEKRGMFALQNEAGKRITPFAYQDFFVRAGALIAVQTYTDAAQMYRYRQHFDAKNRFKEEIFSTSYIRSDGKVLVHDEKHPPRIDTTNHAVLIFSDDGPRLIDFEGNVILADHRFYQMERQPSAIMVMGHGASGFLDAQGKWLLRDTSRNFQPVMARDGWLWYRKNFQFYYGKAILSDSTLGPMRLDRALDTTITAFCRRFPQYAQANAGLVTITSKLVIWNDGNAYKLLMTDGDWIYKGIGGQNALTGRLDAGLVFLNSSKGMAMLDQEGKILIPFLGQYLVPWENRIMAMRSDDKKNFIGLYDRTGRLVMDFVEQ